MICQNTNVCVTALSKRSCDDGSHYGHRRCRISNSFWRCNVVQAELKFPNWTFKSQSSANIEFPCVCCVFFGHHHHLFNKFHPHLPRIVPLPSTKFDIILCNNNNLKFLMIFHFDHHGVIIMSYKIRISFWKPIEKFKLKTIISHLLQIVSIATTTFTHHHINVCLQQRSHRYVFHHTLIIMVFSRCQCFAMPSHNLFHNLISFQFCFTIILNSIFSTRRFCMFYELRVLLNEFPIPNVSRKFTFPQRFERWQ